MIADLKIRYKLALLMLIPLAAFFVLSAVDCFKLHAAWRDMLRLTDTVEVMVRLGGVAHELQKERGLSTGFVGSKGARFVQEVPSQRQSSDEAAKKLEQAVTRFPAVAANADFAAAFNGVRASLEGLKLIRPDVDALKLPAREVIASYNSGIASVIDSCSVILAMAGGSGMTRPAAAFVELLRGKEVAGQERATLNGAFSAGTFTKELYRDWLLRVGSQDSYLTSFSTLGGNQARALFSSKVSASQKDVDTLRETAFRNLDKPALEVDPQTWFKASTARIDALKDLEDAWAAMVKQRAEDIRDKALSDLLIKLAVTVAVAFLTGFLGWRIFRSINLPLMSAVSFASGVADGELNQPPLACQNDDIGKLCAALQAMLTTIKDMIAKAEAATMEAAKEADHAREAARQADEAQAQALTAKRDGLAMAADRLEDVVMSVTAASEELSAEVEQASRGASIQSDRVGETATAMEEMNATVLEVARNAAAASTVSEKARQEAVQGAAVVREAVDGISQARDDSLELKRHMSELDARAKAIGQIMGVISDIADQTNLLALNAAIEAARAGDAGRGFAVVADEVRKLAEKTMTATKEVAESIHGIQSGAATTIHNVEKAVGRIEEATNLAERSGQALERIVALVDESSMQVSSIATASEEQSAASEEINRSLEDVNRVSSETAQAMDQANSAVMELSRQAQKLRDLMAELRRQ